MGGMGPAGQMAGISGGMPGGMPGGSGVLPPMGAGSGAAAALPTLTGRKLA